jgi:hypothetical protein
LHAEHVTAETCETGGFLAYESTVPAELLQNGGPRTGKMDIQNTIGHFDLVNFQLKEVSGVSGASDGRTCTEDDAAVAAYLPSRQLCLLFGLWQSAGLPGLFCSSS